MIRGVVIFLFSHRGGAGRGAGLLEVIKDHCSSRKRGGGYRLRAVSGGRADGRD